MTSDREPGTTGPRPQAGEPVDAVGGVGTGRSSTNVLVAVLVAVLVVGGIVAASLLGGPSGDDVAAEPTTAAQPEPPAEPTAAPAPEPTAAAPVDDTCPPGPEPVAEPVQVDEVPAPVSGTWTATLATTCGDVVVELDADAAPQGVGNFVGLARAGFFDATPCHRLTTSGIFVLQCGDPTGTGTGGPDYRFGPIENAPADDVYPAGTLAMARVGGDGESMGSQFFLVYEDSTIPSDAAGGYTVLGRVTEGLEIVRLVAEGGLAADGVAPARSTGIVSVIAEESA